MPSISIPEINIIPYSIHPADFNMAADEFLLSLPGTFLRFYGWEKPTLSFGRSNTNLDEINDSFRQENGIRTVQRISGGKTILHQHEITYMFCSDSNRFPPSILETYRLISQPLAACFARFGLKPEMKDKPVQKKTKSSICFKEVSAYELTIDGKKVVGSAQFRRRRRFFQHGSILLDIDWDLWKTLWRIPTQSTSLEDRITSIKQQLGYIPEINNFTETLVVEFTKFFRSKATYLRFSESDIAEIDNLSKKYLWKDH